MELKKICDEDPPCYKVVKPFPKVLLSKGKVLSWRTPMEFFYKLDKEFHFALDACTTKNNPLGTEFFYTLEDDGLTKPWIDPTFCNPPYSRKNIVPWLKKAIEEQRRGVTSVLLLPSRTGTSWFFDYVYNKPDVEIRFVKGRLKFLDPEGKIPNTAPFDSLLAIFRPSQLLR